MVRSLFESGFVVDVNSLCRQDFARKWGVMFARANIGNKNHAD